MFVRTTLILTTLIVGACSQAPQIQPMATNTGVCLAIGWAFPIKYHGNSVDPESKGNIQQGNAAVKAACP